MKRSREMALLLLISSVLLLFPMSASSQAQQPPRTAVPGFNQGVDSNTLTMRRGEALFYQRCSLCHLPRIRKPQTTPGPAPSLTGILKNADKDQEIAVRNQIMKGTERMPGWQYGLKPGQMDDLITYLKTL